MPHFAGQKGPEIARSLLEIEATFEKNLSQLRAVKKTILDVKATSWHDDYTLQLKIHMDIIFTLKIRISE
jgi:dynein heavy chain